MNILLVNDNPVVTKLVTLSAQKTGDELEIVNDMEQINAKSYDLLIFDNERFDPMLFDALISEVTFARKLFMGSRDIDKPDGFDVMVNKPFLPTDLVELFTDISHELENLPSDEMPVFEEMALDEEINLEHLDDDDTVDLEQNMAISDDEETMDLDSAIEALSDEEVDLDDALHLEAESDEVSLEVTDEVTEALEEDVLDSILDKDDLEEVQALLEEEALHDTSESDTSRSKENDIVMDDEEVLLEEESDDILLETEAMLEEDSSADNTALDAEALLENEAAEALEIDDNGEEDFTLLEESLEDAVENLSDEELNAPVDEEMLLDIVNDESGAFDEFDALDIHAVRSALGEEHDDVIEDRCDRDTLEQVEEELLSQESDETVAAPTAASDPKNGIEALQAVLRALQNDDVAQSLKAMNITINISFGEK